MANLSFNILLLSGPLMILVALAFVLGWKARSRTRWRWFWAGAAIWAVGVGLKVAFALLLNEPVLQGLRASLSYGGYLVLGSVYIGLLTGVFEIGVTLAAARKWQSLVRNSNRAVAVGIGAGGFEAILVGAAALVGGLVAMSNLSGSEEARTALASSVAATQVVWLIGPVERAIAILCHTSSRTLVLLSVAKRRWAFFWYGFLLLTALDGIAGFAHISGKLGQISTWWIELAIAPFAVASIPIILWCMRRWPVDAGRGADQL